MEDRFGNKVAHVAAYQNDADTLMILIENGVNIYDCKNTKGETPLDIAVTFKADKITTLFKALPV